MKVQYKIYIMRSMFSQANNSMMKMDINFGKKCLESELFRWPLPPPKDETETYDLNSYSDFPLLHNNGNDFYFESPFLSNQLNTWSKHPLMYKQYYIFKGYHRCYRCGQGFWNKSTRRSHSKKCYYQESEYEWEDMCHLQYWYPTKSIGKIDDENSDYDTCYDMDLEGWNDWKKYETENDSNYKWLGWVDNFDPVKWDYFKEPEVELYHQMLPPTTDSGQIGLIAPGTIRNVDSTTLIDPSMGTETSVPLNRLSNMKESVNLSTDITSKLDRRVTIGTFKIPASNGYYLYGGHYPYELFQSNGFYGASIVSTHEYVSIDRLRFTIQIPSEVSITGQIQMFWVPGHISDFVTVDGTSDFGENHLIPDNFIDVHSVILDLGNENSVSLEVPCVSPLNTLRVGTICNGGSEFNSRNDTMKQSNVRFNTYGKLFIRNFTAIRGLDAVGELQAFLSVEPINMKVQFQTKSHPITLDITAPEIYEHGVVLGTLATAGAIAATTAATTAAAAAPAVGAALGTAAVGATIGAISKIGKNCTIFDSVSNDVGTLNLTSAHDSRTCTVIGYKSSDVKSSYYEIENNVETVRDMSKLKSRIASFNWAISDQVGAVKYESFVHPVMGYKINTTSLLNRALETSNLGYLSSFYNYWRGSIDITFEVVGNAFTRGSLAIVHAPNPVNLSSLDIVEKTSLFNTTTFNVQDTRRVVVNIPYNNTTQWGRTWYVNNFYTETPGVVSGDAIGKIHLLVMSPLRYQSISSDTTVTVNVYVSSNDMEFFQPIERAIYSPSPTWFGPQDQVNYSLQTLSDASEIVVNAGGAHVNEEPPKIAYYDHGDLMALTTIRSAYGVFPVNGYVKFTIPIPTTYLTKYNVESDDSSSFVTEYNHTATVSQCFAWYTGSYALTVMNLSPTSRELSYVVSVDYKDIVSGDYDINDRSIETYSSTQQEYVALVKGNNTLAHNFALNQVHSITFPHYNQYNILPAPIVGRSVSTVGGDTLADKPTYYRYATATIIFKGAAGSQILLSQSAGPGLKFMQFLGAPKIYVGTKGSVERERLIRSFKKKKASRPKVILNNKFDPSKGEDVCLRYDPIQEEDSDYDDDTCLKHQGILSKDNQEKVSDTLDMITRVSSGFSHTSKHADEVLSKASDMIPGIKQTTNDLGEAIHEFKEFTVPKLNTNVDSIKDSVASISSSTEKASNSFERMSSKLTDFISKLENKFFAPTLYSKDSVSGLFTKEKEVEMISVFMDCAAHDSILPFVDAVLVELYNLFKSFIPKTSKLYTWVFRMLKGAIGAFFMGTRFGNLMAAEALHETLKFGVEKFDEFILHHQGPTDLAGSVSLAISVILSAITALTFKLALPETMSLLNHIKGTMLIVGSVMSISKFIEAIIKAIAFIKDRYFPTESDEMARHWYQRNIDKVDSMMNIYVLTQSVSQIDVEDDETLCSLVAQIAPFCNEFIINLSKLSSKDSNCKLLIKYAEKLIELATYLKTSLPSKNRPVPVMFTFQGASQIGKTYLVSNILPNILGRALGRLEPMSIYEKNSNSKFYDKYNYQDILLLNDLGSVADQSDLNDILLVMGNQPYALNMAALADKGTMFRSPFAFVTTNSPVIAANKVLNNPEAARNRLYKNSYQVTLNSKYSKNGQIDSKKINLSNPSPDEIWTFTRFTVSDNGDFILGSPRPLKKIILDMVRQYRDNKTNVSPMVAGKGLNLSEFDDIFDHVDDSDDEDDAKVVKKNKWSNPPNITPPLSIPPPRPPTTPIDEIDDSFSLDLKHQTGGLLSGHPPVPKKKVVKYFEQSREFIEKLYERWNKDDTGVSFDKEDTRSPDSSSHTYMGFSRVKCSMMINQLLNWPCPNETLSKFKPKFYKDISVKFGSFPAEAHILYDWQESWVKSLEPEDYRKMSIKGYSKRFGTHSLGGVGKSILGVYQSVDEFLEKVWNFGQGKGGFIIDSLLKFFRAQILIMGFLVTVDAAKYAYGSYSRVFNKEFKLYNFYYSKIGGSYYDKASKDENLGIGERAMSDIFSSYYNPQPQQTSNFYGVTATDATPRKRVPRKLVLKKSNPVQGKSIDMSDIIKENCAILTNVTSGGSQHAIMVGRDVFVTNTHFFYKVKDGDACRLTFPHLNNIIITFNIDFKNHVNYEFETNDRGSVEQDVSFYRIGYDSRSFKDISNHFIKEEDVEKANNCSGYRLEIDPLKQVTTNWRIQDAKVTLGNNRGTLLYTDIVMGMIPGDFGMCGLPFIATNTSYFGNTGKIIGIHGFGTIDRSGGPFVTQEMVSKALGDLPSPYRAPASIENVFVHQTNDMDIDISPSGDQIENMEVDKTVFDSDNMEIDVVAPKYMPTDLEPRIDYEYYTDVRKAKGSEIMFQVSRTAYRKTPMYGKFPITHDYSVASKYDKRLDPEVAYMFDYKLMSKTNSPGIVTERFPSTQKILIRERLLNIWKDKRVLVPGRVLTVDQAINGINFGDNDIWTRDLGLVMNKSAGPVYNKIGKHKYPHFTFIEYPDGSKDYTPKNYLLDRIMDRIEMAKDFRVPSDSLCGDSIKDELRKLEKVESGSSRLVNFFQLDFMIVFGMYFGAFRAMFSDPQNVGTRLFSALGVDPRQLFPAIGRDLKYSRHLFGIDYTAYDSSIPGSLHEFMVSVINAWYLSQGDSPLNCQIREVLWWECVHTKHVYGDTVYTDHHGLPSGVPCGFTTISNILINTILVSITLLRLNIPLDFFGTTIQAIFMGDDNLIWIREDAPKVNELTDKFNRIAVAETALSFGMKATMPNKSTDLTPYDSFQEITFLKSYFKDEVIPGYYLPAMDKATIYSMLTYYKPKGKAIDVNQLTVNISQALDFAVPWGQQFYDELTAVLKEDEQLTSILSQDQREELFIPLVLRFYRAFQ